MKKAGYYSKALHHLIICHPERRARKRSDRARVEGPLHSLLGTLSSGNSHRALCDQTFCRVQVLRHFHRALYDRTSCRVQASGNLLPRTLFICHPEPADCCRVPHLLVILSDARRSVATERESKDLCTLAFPTKYQGILTVHSLIELFAVCKCYGILTVPSMIELLAVCKRRGTCCRLPYSFVILSESKDPMRRFARPDAARTTPEERRFSAAFSPLTNTGL
jgi:hypothetical protein